MILRLLSDIDIVNPIHLISSHLLTHSISSHLISSSHLIPPRTPYRRKRTSSFSSFWNSKAEEQKMSREFRNLVSQADLRDTGSGEAGWMGSFRPRSLSVPAYLSIRERSEFAFSGRSSGYLEFYGFVIYLVSYLFYCKYDLYDGWQQSLKRFGSLFL